MSIMQCLRVMRASAMSIVRSAPAGITGIANVWSNLYHFPKALSSAAFLDPPSVGAYFLARDQLSPEDSAGVGAE